MCTADGSSDAAEEPPPPNSTTGGADRPPIQIPMSWPDDGSLTLEWVENLALIFDWSSKRVPPSDFPSILPVPVLDRIILTASKIVHGEPNCVRVDVPDGKNQRVVVVGDVQEAGPPFNDRCYVFNGDYVDRGAWGLEVLLLLLAWKWEKPEELIAFEQKQQQPQQQQQQMPPSQHLQAQAQAQLQSQLQSPQQVSQSQQQQPQAQGRKTTQSIISGRKATQSIFSRLLSSKSHDSEGDEDCISEIERADVAVFRLLGHSPMRLCCSSSCSNLIIP